MSIEDSIPPAQGWSKSLDDCHKAIRDNFDSVREEFQEMYDGHDLKVDYTYRGKELQFELYKKGRELREGQWVVVDPKLVVTDKDGSKPSHHQTYPAQAADIYITQGDAILWPPASNNSSTAAMTVRKKYEELGKMWEKRGLVSGATWRYSWKDSPHVQVDYAILPA